MSSDRCKLCVSTILLFLLLKRTKILLLQGKSLSLRSCSIPGTSGESTGHGQNRGKASHHVLAAAGGKTPDLSSRDVQASHKDR